MCDEENKLSKFWNPFDNLAPNCISDNVNYALIVLNTRLEFHPHFLLKLWNRAKVRITVDGGTARWINWLKSHNVSLREVAPPELITGDMDSLPRDVLNLICSTGTCTVICTPNQQETDFTKALGELGSYCTQKNTKIDVVYAIAETSGRLDQIIANINTLCKAPTCLPHPEIFQLASNSLTWILFEGTHVIEIPKKLRDEQAWCALIPLTSSSCVTTSGLKWNIVQKKLEYGGLISTSNTYEGTHNVTISTKEKIAWSMGIECLISEDKADTYVVQ